MKNIDLINRKLIENQNSPLNSTEIILLRGILQFKTYVKIAREAEYSPRYIAAVVAPMLFEKISMLLEHRVTKKNIRSILESYIREHQKIEHKDVKK